MRPSELKQFERSVCACDKCKAGCKHMPGSLAPGDMDTIAKFVGADPDNAEFIRQNFRASDGTVVIIEGKPKMVPTIVPAQQEDGRCVFLTDDDQCAIHPVAPFGCRNFEICGVDTEEDEYKSRCQISCILQSHNYLWTWAYLHTTGHIAPPARKRRAALNAELEQLG